MDAVYRLTHDEFVREGYLEPLGAGRLIHYPHLDDIPQTSVLVAVIGGEIVGTNTWTWDGPQGLHVDKDFRTEVDQIRAEGRRLAASWRIVVDVRYQRERSVVMGLIKRTVNDMLAAGVETALFSFHRKHERIYRRLLNMTTMAYCDELPAVVGGARIPAVLMRLDAEQVPQAFRQ